MTLRSHLDGAMFAEHTAGRGPTLLALHGWGRGRSDLMPVLAGRSALAPDLPGFGSSPPPPRAWSIDEYAEAVATLCKEAGSGPHVVVAHSFGGRIAAHLAAAYPEHVSGVVFSGAPLIRGRSTAKPSLLYRSLRSATRRGLIPSRHLEAMRERRGSTDYRNATGVMRDVLVMAVNDDCTPLLPRIMCPVGFCYGALDTAAPPATAIEAAKLVADCRIVDVVEGVGHDVHLGAPERILEVLRVVEGEP